TAAENVALPLIFSGMNAKFRREKALAMLELVGLQSHAAHMPRQLSGGQQQRIGIARALVSDPKIVFADEPTGNLDSKTSVEIMGLLADVFHRLRTTFVMVTHDAAWADYGDQTITISDGKVIMHSGSGMEKYNSSNKMIKIDI
ncbi:MAG: ATP-binding cassette domain-containing protein, partial [Clostridiales bacterium]